MKPCTDLGYHRRSSMLHRCQRPYPWKSSTQFQVSNNTNERKSAVQTDKFCLKKYLWIIVSLLREQQNIPEVRKTN